MSSFRPIDGATSYLSIIPGEELGLVDVEGVAGGLVVVVGLVLGPDAVGRDVPLEHHPSHYKYTQLCFS